MHSERLRRLHEAGQAIWLDYIDRTMLRNGDLQRRIREDSLTGMTSNPTIFEKALAEGSAYDDQIANSQLKTPWELFELLETDDVRDACDAFSGVYKSTLGRDGFVSIEVSPGVAHDASATVEEAHRLWRTVSRPNLMVKVPGTEAGAAALAQLIRDGINVNVTLLFSTDAYDRIIRSYIGALEDRLGGGERIDSIASVASFFVSRVDTEIDKQLDQLAARGAHAGVGPESLKGRAAVANAKIAYALFQNSFAGERWAKLSAHGAGVQRPLWASTSTKNPAYRDVMYVERLIGPSTVNTMPPATLEAFRDHGETARTVDVGVEEEKAVIGKLDALGISLNAVTDKLLLEGLASFQKSFDTLIGGLEHKMSAIPAQQARG